MVSSAPFAGAAMGHFFAELKRRQMFRVAAAYAVVAWMLLQLINNLTPALRLPDWAATLVVVFLVAGFPIALLFCWIQHLPSAESSAPSAKTVKLDWLLIGALAIVLSFMGYQTLTTPQAGVDAAKEAALSPRTGVSLAVLPFANLSDDETQTFFSDGMTEEIITALARIPDLRVVARESASQFKGQQRDLRAVGQALGATHLIEGSVRKAGARVRITARLVKADDGVNAWTNSYDRELTDVFAVQEEIATSIAGALRMPLGLKQGERLVSNRNIDPDSYQQYLRARAFGSNGRESLRAIPLLEPLVARNPDYAPAWAQLALVYQLTPNFSRNGPLEELRRVVREVVPKADAAGRRAIQLDPNLAYAYNALAHVQVIQGKLLAAEELYSKALALDPNSTIALGGYSNLLAVVGRLKESIAMKDQVRALEPTGPGLTQDTAQMLWVTGQNDAAIALFKDLPSGVQGLEIDRARIYASMGRYNEAADSLQRITGGNLSAETLAAGVRLLRSAPAETPALVSLPRLGTIGFIYLYVGAPLRAFEPIEEWGEAGFYISGGADNAFLWHPSYAAVRKSERFKTFMRKAGYVEYWRAKGWPEFCHPTTGDDFVCD